MNCPQCGGFAGASVRESQDSLEVMINCGDCGARWSADLSRNQFYEIPKPSVRRLPKVADMVGILKSDEEE